MILRRPMISLEVAAAISDLPAQRLLALVESGDILFAFDLAAPGAARKMPRLLASSLVHYLESQPPLNPAPELPGILDSIYPPGIHPDAVAIARTWLSDSEHIHDLVRAKCLRRGPGSISRRGPNGSPRIDRGSLCSFLESRRMI